MTFTNRKNTHQALHFSLKRTQSRLFGNGGQYGASALHNYKRKGDNIEFRGTPITLHGYRVMHMLAKCVDGSCLLSKLRVIYVMVYLHWLSDHQQIIIPDNALRSIEYHQVDKA